MVTLTSEKIKKSFTYIIEDNVANINNPMSTVKELWIMLRPSQEFITIHINDFSYTALLVPNVDVTLKVIKSNTIIGNKNGQLVIRTSDMSPFHFVMTL